MPVLPLDELQFTEKDSLTGKTNTLPALHPRNKTDRSFVVYKPLPGTEDPALVQEFLERARFIARDLDWLLALPHDKFWCQVIFDESLQKCLDSYLRHAPRQFDTRTDLPAEVKDLEKHLHRNVFLTFLRMSTHKESKDHFITPSVFGEVLYNNFLFDIPKILDLCVLFGKGNGPLLQKMIACQTFQKHDFCFRLAAFYELVIPELESAIKKRHPENIRVLSDLWRRLSHSRKKMVEMFHMVVHQLCLQPILESSCDNIQAYVEEFLQIFTSVLQETSTSEQMEHFEEQDHLECAGAAAAPIAPISGVELDSLISQVKDLLPDLGEGFVLACLEEYNYNVEHEQRERYNQYSIIVEEVPEPSGDRLFSQEDYEDEYDDTYDGNQVGANDADSDDELISRRPFTIPQVLRPKEEEQEEEEDEEEAMEDREATKDHFVQDPAVLRERAEARRMTFLARKG
ncbi:putative Activating signal cointegrator 1 complex subunit 2 isoform 1 protein [Naja naja]|nr:putative Activating signal cointegrator 1 complex subunit 2 isoform 1 protein [Naja naja]